MRILQWIKPFFLSTTRKLLHSQWTWKSALPKTSKQFWIFDYSAKKLRSDHSNSLAHSAQRYSCTRKEGTNAENESHFFTFPSFVPSWQWRTLLSPASVGAWKRKKGEEKGGLISCACVCASSLPLFAPFFLPFFRSCRRHPLAAPLSLSLSPPLRSNNSILRGRRPTVAS